MRIPQLQRCFLKYTKEHFVEPLKQRAKAGKAEWEWLIAFMKTRPSGGGTYPAKGEDMPDPPAPITVDQFCRRFRALESQPEPGGPPGAKVAATPLRAGRTRALNWKGGLKVLRQAQLPKWRASFQWQIEAKIEALQAEYATLRAEYAKPDG